MKNNPHSNRRCETMPDFARNVNSQGQMTASIGFRKGGPVDEYVRLRQWCWQHGVNFSDIINGIIGPITEACHTFARLDNNEKDVIVTMNFGDVRLRKVYGNRGGAHISQAKPPQQIKLTRHLLP